jgi:hypothetical protein
VLRTHEISAQLRKFAFTVIRKPAKQLLAGDKSDNGIAQEFHLLVVRFVLRLLLRLGFARMRTMRERLREQLASLERVPDTLFQARDVGLNHLGRKLSCGWLVAEPPSLLPVNAADRWLVLKVAYSASCLVMYWAGYSAKLVPRHRQRE